MTSDRIEKKIVLRAPIERVWRAIANSDEFGAWFGMRLAGPFVPGARVAGQITNPPEYAHLKFDLAIERVEPHCLLSFRWHPYDVEPGVDTSTEPTTLVEFQLSEAPGGTKLTLTESGFDQIPLARRAEAYRMNDEGWTEQLMNIERHVAT